MEYDFSSAMSVASSGMKAQANRIRHVSENIANTDTPGYQRKLVTFEQVIRGTQAGQVATGRVQLDRTEVEKIFNPDHPLADADGYHDGSNVNLIIEIADAREAQRSYEANLKVFDQVRQMSSSLMELLRR